MSGGDTISLFPATISLTVSFISLTVSFISLTVSFISSILVLGYPAEIYTFGGQYFLAGFGFALGYILSAYLYVPVLYPLGTLTTNEVRYINTFIQTYVKHKIAKRFDISFVL